MLLVFKFLVYLFHSLLTKSNVPNLNVTGELNPFKYILINCTDLRLSIPLTDLKNGLYLLLL